MIKIIGNLVNSTVPIAAELLKSKGMQDPWKLFGVTTLDVVHANTFVAEKKKLGVIDVDVPIIGGHVGITILPQLSKTNLTVEFTLEEIEELTVRIHNAGTEAVEAKVGVDSATLSMVSVMVLFKQVHCFKQVEQGEGLFIAASCSECITTSNISGHTLKDTCC